MQNHLLGIHQELNELSDELGAPRAWVVCPHCGAQGWRLPPHGIAKACPIVKSMTDSVGLKFDAERNFTITSRQQMERFTQLFEEQAREEEGEEE